MMRPEVKDLIQYEYDPMLSLLLMKPIRPIGKYIKWVTGKGGVYKYIINSTLNNFRLY